MVRCAITEGVRASSDGPVQWHAVLESARRWAAEGIEIVQLREKHLDGGELFHLAQQMLGIFRAHGNGRTQLLINGRPDVAAAARADGVHLTSRPGELTPAQVRTLYAHASLAPPVVSVSCHTLDEVRDAKEHAPAYILFGPVFEKRVGAERVTLGVGLAQLSAACASAGRTPVLALGGVEKGNLSPCLAAGAAGIAAIRLFNRPL